MLLLYDNLCIFLKCRLDLVRKEYQYCLNRKQHPFIAGYYQLTNSLVKTKWQSLKCLNQEKSTSSSTLVVSEPVTYLVLSLNSLPPITTEWTTTSHLKTLTTNTDHDVCRWKSRIVYNWKVECISFVAYSGSTCVWSIYLPVDTMTWLSVTEYVCHK